ncbi:MAG: A/G-specific adenine glycosylase [Pedosphaera sp.]|nr:A/G-specific adenine glycosylase [Pedosphaera sp.]
MRGNPKSKIQNPKPARLVQPLLAWFARNARDLPWRRTRDPYAIWVSEIMLQQTQVKTVIRYWERWMRELPMIQSVAKASPAKLHKLWEGLGYYTRVRNLQRAAQQIIANNRRAELRDAQNNGDSRSSSLRFPENFDAILALPGIGRYTAGAIASIAFNQPYPILDGNVIRVLTRVFGIRTNPRDRKTNTQLWQLAGELVLHASRFTHHLSPCSHLNQSLMELGALICTPRSPRCGVCPVKTTCVAREKNLQDQLPNLTKREAATARRFIAFIVEHDGKFLVRQRPAGTVNAHLWEFPNFEVGARVYDPQQLRQRKGRTNSGIHGDTEVLRLTEPRSEIIRKSRFQPNAAKPLCTIKHSITRYRITLEAWRAELRQPRTGTDGQWRTREQLHQLAFTSAHKNILSHLDPKSPA